DRAAHALRRLGVTRGERIALLLPDGPPFVASFFAALRLGAVAVPLNTRLGPGEVRAILEDAGAVALVADPALLEAVRPAVAAAGVARVITWDELIATTAASEGP